MDARSPLLLALLIPIAVGCGPAGDLDIVPVSGRVTVGGEPVANVVVTFKPIPGEQTNPGPTSAGLTDADGRYTVSTERGTIRRGAVPGEHRVTFEGAEAIGRSPKITDDVQYDDDGNELPIENPVPKPTVRIPEEHRTGRTFTVPADGTDAANFDL